MGAIAGGPLRRLEARQAPFLITVQCLSTGSATEENSFFFFGEDELDRNKEKAGEKEKKVIEEV